MPLKLEIIRATEFVRVGAEGHFDLPASKAALAAVARACHKRGIQNAIIDLRALHPGPKPVFSPADLVELVNTFPEVGFTHDLRLAIVYSSDPHKRARLFSFLSTLHGWSVQAFGDFEAALLWLSSGQQENAEPQSVLGKRSGGRRIAIREGAAGRRTRPAKRSGRTTVTTERIPPVFKKRHARHKAR